jgi:hypothetical protein
LNCTIVRREDARRFGFPAKLPSPIKSPISSTTPGGSRKSSLLSSAIKKSSSSVEPECSATTAKRRTVLRDRERARARARYQYLASGHMLVNAGSCSSTITTHARKLTSV